MVESLDRKVIMITGLSILVFSVFSTINVYSSYINAYERMEKSGYFLIERAIYHIRAETNKDAEILVENTLENFDFVISHFNDDLKQALRNEKGSIVVIIEDWDIYNQPLEVRKDISFILMDLHKNGELVSASERIWEYMMENEKKVMP